MGARLAARPVAVPVYCVDAFTTRPFGGNPAAVCLLLGPAGETWMQQVAAELAQPTTAFAHVDHDGRWHLRWFTPTAELPLCGHATLATAHVLHETGTASLEQALSFQTSAGVIEVDRHEGRLWLDLPAVALTEAPVPASALGALGLQPEQVCWFGYSDYEYVLILDQIERLERLRPDLTRVRELPVPRTIVTAAGGHDADLTSRVFVPAVGLDEDAATGSAHAVLGPLWAGRLGRDDLRAAQASARGGQLALVVRSGRVHVGGHAVITTRGELLAVPADGSSDESATAHARR
jgi:PhzF family phenazine biosynthesis protein